MVSGACFVQVLQCCHRLDSGCFAGRNHCSNYRFYRNFRHPGNSLRDSEQRHLTLRDLPDSFSRTFSSTERRPAHTNWQSSSVDRFKRFMKSKASNILPSIAYCLQILSCSSQVPATIQQRLISRPDLCHISILDQGCKPDSRLMAILAKASASQEPQSHAAVKTSEDTSAGNLRTTTRPQHGWR